MTVRVSVATLCREQVAQMGAAIAAAENVIDTIVSIAVTLPEEVRTSNTNAKELCIAALAAAGNTAPSASNVGNYKNLILGSYSAEVIDKHVSAAVKQGVHRATFQRKCYTFAAKTKGKPVTLAALKKNVPIAKGAKANSSRAGVTPAKWASSYLKRHNGNQLATALCGGLALLMKDMEQTDKDALRQAAAALKAYDFDVE